MSDRFRDESVKIGTGIENCELDRIPAAADVMLSPLGSPTVMPTSGRMLARELELDCRKIVFVAPESWIGVFGPTDWIEVALFRLPVRSEAMWSPLVGPAAVPPSVIRF